MKSYIIAALLFVVGLLGLGVLTANLMSPPKPKPQPHPIQNQAAHPLYSPSGPSEASYPAAAPKTGGMGTSPRMSGMPEQTPAMPGALPGAGTLPGSAGPSGVAGTIGISAPPAIPVPRPPPSEQPPSVPIIQPTDIGEQASPTAGKSHQ